MGSSFCENNVWQCLYKGQHVLKQTQFTITRLSKQSKF